ncbi:ATP-binding protein [Priestia aryabhattai]|uniref:ATP-binding protein n=1 Tax=Priestia aryabhattai TaxID=412384 RepID=UPI0035AB7441
MKNLTKEINNMTSFSSRVIREYKCNKCGELIKVLELVINDKIRIANRCKACDERELEREALHAYNNLKNSKRERLFNDFSLISEGLKKATFDNYHPINQELSKAKQVAKSYLDNFDKISGLLFVGDCGVGKSHLSYSICKEAREKGISSIFISVPELLTQLKSTFNKNKNYTEEDLLSALKNVDLLVLDDIGADYPTDWAITKLFEIINSRVGKSTIYTTNSNAKELASKVGKRNFSRMMENAQIIKMQGDDYRLKNLKN